MVKATLKCTSNIHGRLWLTPAFLRAHHAQVVVEFAKGASGFRLFAAMVEDDLVVTSNPAKFPCPVREDKRFVPLFLRRDVNDGTYAVEKNKLKLAQL